MINGGSELARRYWDSGMPDDCPIVDVHAHMHEWAASYMPSASPEAMIRTMDRCGTRLTLFCSHLALNCPEIGEEANIGPVRRFPGRFMAYHAVQGGNADPARDIQRVRDNRDVYAGYKFLCDYHHVALSDARFNPYWEHADEDRLLVLMHTWGGSPYDGVDEVRKIAERYRRVTLICGHSFHGDWDNGFELAEYPNVFFELTAVLDDRGVLEKMVEKVGSDRILFGTDLPWFSTHHGVGALLSAEMTDGDRHNILHRNADKLLRSMRS
jgi:predicted TIM-barrel fold metal-dependent hydrolase